MMTCKYCHGKGFYTRAYSEIGSPDFPGDKGYVVPLKIDKVKCKCQKLPEPFHDEKLIKKALEKSCLNQRIQERVWKYMQEEPHMRNGVDMTDDILKMCEDFYLNEE